METYSNDDLYLYVYLSICFNEHSIDLYHEGYLLTFLLLITPLCRASIPSVSLILLKGPLLTFLVGQVCC